LTNPLVPDVGTEHSLHYGTTLSPGDLMRESSFDLWVLSVADCLICQGNSSFSMVAEAWSASEYKVDWLKDIQGIGRVM
jgi:hypothetical protein